MRVKKEVDIVLMIVFIILFFGFGSYIGVKELNNERIININKDYTWEAVGGAEEVLPESIPKEAVEEMPVIVEEPKQNFRIIEIKDTKFNPNELNISVGMTVYWVNNDPKRNYLVYEKSANQVFNSFQLRPFESFNYTFNKAGVYYFNDGIFTFMSGVIRVS